MIQGILTVIIVAAALLFAAWRLIRFLRRPDEIACSPEKCATCSLKGPGCEETMKGSGNKGSSCCG